MARKKGQTKKAPYNVHLCLIFLELSLKDGYIMAYKFYIYEILIKYQKLMIFTLMKILSIIFILVSPFCYSQDLKPLGLYNDVSHN